MNTLKYDSYAPQFTWHISCTRWRVEYRLSYKALLQKRPIILSILLTKATPYVFNAPHFISHITHALWRVSPRISCTSILLTCHMHTLTCSYITLTSHTHTQIDVLTCHTHTLMGRPPYFMHLNPQRISHAHIDVFIYHSHLTCHLHT